MVLYNIGQAWSILFIYLQVLQYRPYIMYIQTFVDLPAVVYEFKALTSKAIGFAASTATSIELLIGILSNMFFFIFFIVNGPNGSSRPQV